MEDNAQIVKWMKVSKFDSQIQPRNWEEITLKYAEKMGVLWGIGGAFYVTPNTPITEFTIMHPCGVNYQFEFDCRDSDEMLHARITHACTLIQNSILNDE